MKRLCFLFAMAAVSMTGMAQVISDGFYRVQNTRTQRWCVLADDYAYVDESASGAGTGSVYLQAIRTYKPFEHVVSDPGSIIKFTYSQKGKGYTLAAQGTDTYTMLKKHGEYYLTLRQNGKAYTASAYAKGFNIHLSDERLENDEKYDTLGYMQPTGEQYQYWYITKVDASTDNYFGFKPILSAAGKNYLPFYAGFSFKKHSDGIRAFYIDSIKPRAGVARYREITDETLPAGVPMIIETSSSEPANNKVDVVDGDGTAPAGNLLQGVYFCSVKEILPYYDDPGAHHEDVYTSYDPSTMRLLGVDNDRLVLRKSSTRYVPANSFYLPVPADCADVVRIVDAAEFAATVEPDPQPTGIESVKTETKSNDTFVYNLKGQRVSANGLQNLPSGIYIYQGRKVVVK